MSYEQHSNDKSRRLLLRGLELGVSLGLGCAAGAVQKLGDGMTNYQIAKMLDELSNQEAWARAIAGLALEDAEDGKPNPVLFKSLVERLAEAIEVSNGT